MARQGRGYWERAVRKFEASELTQEAFCEAQGLTVGTFRSWLYRLRRERGAGMPAFVEVVASKESFARQACVVRIGGAELRFESLPDVQYLGALLRAGSSEPR
jgi:hypothetical protein